MNRDELITALQVSAAQKPRAVFVKGWGDVHVRALTVAEVEEQTAEQEEAKTVDAEGKEVTEKQRDKNRLARSAARLLCDAQGARLLDPDNPEDVALLSRQPWSMLRQILAASDDLKEDAAGN